MSDATRDRIEGEWDQTKGRAESAWGEVTGNEQARARGEAD